MKVPFLMLFTISIFSACSQKECLVENSIKLNDSTKVIRKFNKCANNMLVHEEELSISKSGKSMTNGYSKSYDAKG